MDEEILAGIFWHSLAMKLAAGVFMSLAVWGLLKLFDRLAGVQWDADVWKVMARDPRALSDYYGKRVLAFAIGFGLVFS